MPTYDYRCDRCNCETEVEQSIKDPPLTKCPHCGEDELRRLISSSSGSGFVLNGDGWFKKGGY